jgi:uroporphyrinogen-III synthase
MTSAGERPLEGLRVLVTRRPEQASELSRRLAEVGAAVVEVATVAIEAPLEPSALDQSLGRLDDYDWLVLTSANAAAVVSDRLRALRLGFPPRLRIAAVGPASARAVAIGAGRPADLQPSGEFRSEALADAFSGTPLEGRRVLMPVSDRARDVLPVALRSKGAVVDVVVAYRTVAPADLKERIRAALRGGIDVATFASPSAVENFTSGAGDLGRGLAAGVIGPVTERTARQAGLRVVAVASPSTAQGLVSALAGHFRGAREP